MQTGILSFRLQSKLSRLEKSIPVLFNIIMYKIYNRLTFVVNDII